MLLPLPTALGLTGCSYVRDPAVSERHPLPATLAGPAGAGPYRGLVNLDVRLFAQSIEPALSRFLTLNLLELLRNSVPDFRQRNKIRRLLFLAIQNVKRIADLNAGAYLLGRKRKCRFGQVLVQSLFVDPAPISSIFGGPIHRISLGQSRKVGALFRFLADLLRHLLGASSGIGHQRIRIKHNHAQLYLFRRCKFFLVGVVISVDLRWSRRESAFHVVLAHDLDCDLVLFFVAKSIHGITLRAQRSHKRLPIATELLFDDSSELLLDYVIGELVFLLLEFLEDQLTVYQ